MPKIASDYSKTKMYKIVHKDDYDNTNIYIGHTTNWVKRKSCHKARCRDCNCETKEKMYNYINNHGGWEEWKMIEIEKYPCNDGNEARAREEYWRCYFNAQLNSKKSFTTEEEAKQMRVENGKLYTDKHKDKIAKYKKNYAETNREKIREYQKEYMKQYRLNY